MIYSDLVTAVTGYGHRRDSVALMPTLMALAEQRIYFGENNVDPLRISQMLKTVTLTNSTLPTDFLEAKRISSVDNSGSYQTLDYLPYDMLAAYQGTYGPPNTYSIVGSTLYFAGAVPANGTNLVYYARLKTPVVDADTNWVLTNAPGVYLSAVLIELAKYTQDNDLLVREVQNFASSMNTLNKQDDASQHSGSNLRMVADNNRMPRRSVR